LGHTRRPLSTNHSLYVLKLVRGCYPERNFERNQLLGSSMSLSPLYTAQTNDLHVSTAAGVHQPFDWLPLGHVKITTFRVYILLLCRPAPVNRNWLTRETFLPSLRSRALAPLLAAGGNSLIRVERRAVCGCPRSAVVRTHMPLSATVSRLLSGLSRPTFHLSLTLLNALSD